jgi:exonuclease VII small subunit
VTEATKRSLSDIVADLEAANKALEAAKDAELAAIEERKACAGEQKAAQQEFNDAVNSLKRRRAPKTEAVKPKATTKKKKEA